MNDEGGKSPAPTSDERFVDGVRYRSASEIAAMHGYVRDHVARLCRQGKVRGIRVSTTWYVDEISFLTYLRRYRMPSAANSDYTPSAENDLSPAPSEQEKANARETLPHAITLVPPNALHDHVSRLQMRAARRALVTKLFSTATLALILTVGAFALAAPNATRTASAQAEMAAAAADPGGFLGGLGDGAKSLARSFATRVDDFIFGIALPGATLTYRAPAGVGGNTIQNSAPTARVATAASTTTTTAAASLPSLRTIVEQPIIQHIDEQLPTPAPAQLASANFVTQDQLNTGLSQLGNSLRGLVFQNISSPNSLPASGGITNTVALTNRIDNLSGTTITNPTISGGSISGVTLSAGDLSGVVAIAKGGTGTTTAPVYGQLLVGNASGTYSLLATSSLGIVGGSDTQIQFNNNGAFGGDASFTFSTSTKQLGATGAVFTNATTTNATSTNFFAQNASTTNATSTSLFSVLGNFTTGIIDTLSATVATITSLTATNLVAINATTTNATTTNLAFTNATGTNATSTNLFAQGASFGSLALGTALPVASGGTNQTSYTAGELLSFNGTSFVSTSTIGNNQLQNSSVTVNGTNIALGGSGTVAAASSTLLANNNTFSGTDTFSNTITGSVSGNAGTATALQTARTINGVSFNGTANIVISAASSTLLTDNNSFTGRNVFKLINLSATSSTLLATDANGNVIATTTIGTNLLTGTLGTVNGQTLTAGGSITITAASSTLLTDNNSFTGLNTFSNATATLATLGTTYFSGLTNSLLSTNANGQVVATTSIGTNYLTGNLATINGTTVANGGTYTITAASSTLLSNNNTFSGNNTFSQTITGSVSGNAGTATALQTARTINGVSFNGTANIVISAASSTLLANSNTFSGNNTFNGLSTLSNASSSLLSVTSKAYFGGTATTTIDSAGNVAVAGALNVTGNTTLANATSTALFSTSASAGTLVTSGNATVGGQLLVQTNTSFLKNVIATSVTGQGPGSPGGPLTLAGGDGYNSFDNGGSLYLYGGFGGFGSGINGNVFLGTDSSGVIRSKIGIGTTSPYAQLSLAGAAGGTTPLLSISSSTAAFATTTVFAIDQNGNTTIGNNGSVLTINGATTTSANGINLASGCFAVGGNCLTLGSFSGTLTVPNGGTGATSLTGLLQGNGTGAITGVTGTAGQFPYFNGANTLGATSSLFLASSGNVGIGTTSPGSALSVQGNGLFSGNVSVAGITATGTLAVAGATTLSSALTYGGVTLSNAVTGTGNMVLATSPTLTTPVLGVAAGTSLSLGGAIIGTNALAVTGTANISSTVTASSFSGSGAGLTGTASSLNIGGTAPAGSLTGSTLNSGVTASSLTSVGSLTTLRTVNIGIGQAAGTTPLQLSYNGTTDGFASTYTETSGAASTYPLVFYTNNGGTQSGNINVTSAGNTTYNTTSDRRLKENIATTTAGLSTLLQIPVDDFNFISDPTKTREQGFIAQTLENIYPEAVTTNGDNGLTPLGASSTPWSVDYGRITPLIVKAVQDIANLSDTFKQTLIAWLGNASNGIDQFFANVGNFHTVNSSTDNTQQLCITNGPTDQTPTCVTKAQLAALLSQSAAADLANPAPAPSPSTPLANPAPAASSSPLAASNTPPTLTINGDNPAIVQVGATYNDLGATITGPQADLNLGIKTFLNGMLTSNIVVDTSQAATDTIDYVVTDSAGLAATSTRTIVISAPVAPNTLPATASSTVATSTPIIISAPVESNTLSASASSTAATSSPSATASASTTATTTTP